MPRADGCDEGTFDERERKHAPAIGSSSLASSRLHRESALRV